MELCTKSQSIVTNFISRTRNICHIHEDVMHTCNFMKTPKLFTRKTASIVELSALLVEICDEITEDKSWPGVNASVCCKK